MSAMGSHDVHNERPRPVRWYECPVCDSQYSSLLAKEACEDEHLTERRSR